MEINAPTGSQKYTSMKGILDVTLRIVDIFSLTIASVDTPNIREERHNEWKPKAQQFEIVSEPYEYI